METTQRPKINYSNTQLEEVLTLIKENLVRYYARKTMRLIFETWFYLFGICCIIFALIAVDLSFSGSSHDPAGNLFYYKITYENVQIIEQVIKLLLFLVAAFSIALGLYLRSVRRFNNKIRKASKMLENILSRN